MTAKKFFHTEVAEGIYQISDTDKGPLESEPKSLAPGKATRNSYLVTGEREALLFDLALSVKGLRAYAESIAELPVRVVLSHAHVDHIYHVNREKEIWLHPADEKLLKKGMFPIQFPPLPCPALRFLHDGDTIDLGGRVLDVIHMPGHTDGSILLYDRNTKTLLSGDSVTRRLLYGMHSFVPIEEFCRGLHSLDLFKIETIYSAHDRCGLYPEHTKLMEKVMMKKIEIPAKTDKVPFVGIFETYETGNEYEREYMSFAIVHKKR